MNRWLVLGHVVTNMAAQAVAHQAPARLSKGGRVDAGPETMPVLVCRDPVCGLPVVPGVSHDLCQL